MLSTLISKYICIYLHVLWTRMAQQKRNQSVAGGIVLSCDHHVVK